MLDKILIAIWFILRPKYYFHFFSLIKRKFLYNHDTSENSTKAFKWAEVNAISYTDALKKLDIKGMAVGLDNDSIEESRKLEAKSSVKMGGAGYIDLLYDCVRLLKVQNVIETGVAYGWSSLAILKALSQNGKGKLYSVDMPYPRKKNENDVGIVVPQNLRKNWTLIRRPDNPGIIIALSKAGGEIDLCHYDSDKSWWGRHYAYNKLWNCLSSKGLFISDDIQDNLYFSEFVKKKLLNFAVVEFKGKFIGLIRKD
ncbi:class I SAM-dependent methyltransferase [Candidatus Pelagibacter sp.]|nr:class I SAM-dependent methyltransferase [Candidatus Pelagibacter sp.]